MDEWSVKKILARRVCKTFSEMRTFLVERFTAKSFFVSFFDAKKSQKISRYLEMTVSNCHSEVVRTDEESASLRIAN